MEKKSRFLTIVWLGAMAALAGCAAPHPPRPVKILPHAVDLWKTARSSQEAPAASRGPLTLGEAIAIARRQNPDIGMTLERIAQARADAGEAASAFSPILLGRLSYVLTDHPAQAFGMMVAQREFAFTPALDINDPGTTDNFRPEVVAAYSLFRGFQDRNRYRAARIGVEVRKLERDAVRNAIVTAVIDTFYALLAAREQAAVARASIETIEAEHRITKARFDSGAALKSDFLSLEVRLAGAREGRVRADNGVETARAILATLLGIEDASTIRPAVPEEGVVAPPAESLEVSLSLALARRPEVLAAEGVTRIREHEVSAERGARLPSMDAFASYGQDLEHPRLSGSRDNWAVGVQVELSIFSGFRTTQRIRRATHRLAEARIAVRKARLDVEREVRTAYLTLQNALERVRVTEASETQAEEALRLVREQYRAGTTPVTRYLEAEEALAGARSMRIASRYDVMRARAGLRKATGELP